jgi:hypothetical protein
MTTSRNLVNKYRVPLLILALLCLVWPIVVDEAAMARFFYAHFLSPSADGVMLAAMIKITSFIAGGVLGAVCLVTFKNVAVWKLWTMRIAVALVLSGVFFAITWLADFSRDASF